MEHKSAEEEARGAHHGRDASDAKNEELRARDDAGAPTATTDATSSPRAAIVHSPVQAPASVPTSAHSPAPAPRSEEVECRVAVVEADAAASTPAGATPAGATPAGSPLSSVGSAATRGATRKPRMSDVAVDDGDELGLGTLQHRKFTELKSPASATSRGTTTPGSVTGLASVASSTAHNRRASGAIAGPLPTISARMTADAAPGKAGGKAPGAGGNVWKRPNVDMALSYRKNLIWGRGRTSVCSWKYDVLDEMGVGIALHFRIIRLFVIFFAVAALITVPLMFFAAQGERLSSEEWDPLRLSLISIANVGNSTTFGNYTLSVGSTTYSARWISNLFSVIDILYSACIVLLMVVLQRTISYVRLKVGSSSLSASEYAIYVDGIPRDVTEEELREHFSNLYNLHAEDWVYASHWRACWCGRKTLQRHKFAPAINAPQAKARINLDKPMPASTMLDVYLPPGSVGFTSSGAGDADAVFSAIQPPEGMLALHATHGSLRPTLDADVTPVQDTRNSGDDAYLNTWVGEVSLATANGTLIRRYQALAGLFRRIRLARAAVRKYSVGSPYAHEKRRAHALKSLAAIEARLEFIDKKYSQEFSTDTVAAYVVFNCEESLTRCVADYRGSANVCSPAYWCQPRPLRLRQGKHHIRVSRAPDPSQIIWQNLELTPRARLLRQVGTGFLVALLLVVSLFFIMLAQGYQQRFRATMPNLNSCGTLLPALAFGKQVTSDGVLDETIANNTLPEPLVLMRNNSDATCAAQGLTRIHWTAPSHPGVPILTSPTSTDPCYNDCFSSDSSGSCALNTTTPGTALSVPRQLTVTCYCVSRLRTLLDQKGVFDAANTLYREDRDMCTSSATNFLAYNAFILLASGIVVFINLMLTTTLRVVTSMEGHTSIDAMYRSQTIKTFVALFLNTACLVLLINAALPATARDIKVGDAQLFNGNYNSFDVRWQAVVGTSLVVTMLLNILTPHAHAIYQLFFVFPCLRCCSPRAATQSELNEKLAPPDFRMPARTASMLNTVFTCLAYSGGQPIMLAVATISMVVSFYIDKISLLRLYRKPARHDHAMARLVLSALPVALALHLAFSVWMYSDPTVLYSPEFNGNALVNMVRATSDTLSDTFGGLVVAPGTTQASVLGLNVGARIRRENTLPIFLLLLFFVIGWLVSVLFVGILRPLLACCGCCARMECARCCAERVPKLHNPPFTGLNAMPMAHEKRIALSPEELANGWRFWRDEHGQLTRVRAWPAAGVACGGEHERGDRMLTWETIAHTGIASYDIAANPLYAPVVRAIIAAQERFEAKVAACVAAQLEPSNPATAVAAATAAAVAATALPATETVPLPPSAAAGAAAAAGKTTSVGLLRTRSMAAVAPSAALSASLAAVSTTSALTAARRRKAGAVLATTFQDRTQVAVGVQRTASETRRQFLSLRTLPHERGELPRAASMPPTVSPTSGARHARDTSRFELANPVLQAVSPGAPGTTSIVPDARVVEVKGEEGERMRVPVEPSHFHPTLAEDLGFAYILDEDAEDEYDADFADDYVVDYEPEAPALSHSAVPSGGHASVVLAASGHSALMPPSIMSPADSIMHRAHTGKTQDDVLNFWMSRRSDDIQAAASAAAAMVTEASSHMQAHEAPQAVQLMAHALRTSTVSTRSAPDKSHDAGVAGTTAAGMTADTLPLVHPTIIRPAPPVRAALSDSRDVTPAATTREVELVSVHVDNSGAARPLAAVLPAGAHGPPAAAAASTGSRSSRTGPHADDSQRGSPRLLRTHEAKAGDDGDEKEGDGHTEVVRNPMHSNS